MTSQDEDAGRGTGRYREEPWCKILREAAKVMTRDQLAKKVNFSRAKTQNILGGQDKPAMDDLVRLAEALNISKLRLLAAAGYLDGIDNLITYLDQLEEQAERIDHSAKQLTSAPLEGATRIASAALSNGNYGVQIEPVWIGTGYYRRHYDDRVIFRRLDGQQITGTERKRVEVRIQEELAWYSAGFVDGWPGEPQELAVRVPRFVAPRHSTGSPAPGLPRSVAVVGGHWAGSADVASMLAYAFDYDYNHVAFVASRAFSRLTHDWENAFRERDRLEAARTYVEGSAIGRHRVWAADVGDSDEAIKIIATSKGRKTPFVISLRPSDDLLLWAAHVRSQLRHTHDDPVTGLQHLREARARVDSSLELLLERQKGQVIDVPLPLPNAISPSGDITDDGDAWFNAWARAAEEAIERMRISHGFPIDTALAIGQMRAGGTTPAEIR